MNQKHILQAFKTLFVLQKSGKAKLSKKEILQNNEFDNLCRYLKKHIRKIDVNDALEALKTLSFLGVPGDSTIVQTILQMLRHYINDLSVNQIIFLEYVLTKMQSTPLRDALCIALPIVFEAQMLFRLDKDNIKEIISCLYYISKKNVSDKCKIQIITSLIKCLESNYELSGEQAKSILWSICFMKEDEIFEPVIKATVPFLIRNLQCLSYNEIETTLQLLLQKYSPTFPFYYSAKLFDQVGEYLIDKDLGFQNGIYCLHKYLKMGHCYDPLMNYVSSKCENNPDLILNGNPKAVFILCTAIASTDYRPPQWETLKKQIYRTECFENCLQTDVHLLKLCSTLCILNIFKEDVFEQCLKEDYIQSIIKRSNVSDIKHFLTILQTILIFKPEYAHLLPPKHFIEEFVNKYEPVSDFPLEAPLQKALGGGTYVASNMKTKLGHHIDHVIILRKGGYPVAFTKQETFLENLEVLPENQIVLISTLRPWHYSINCRRINGITSHMIKTLQAKGYTVIPVCLEEWESLADFEKIPYLMQAIKIKVEEFNKCLNVLY
ncbi:uncharacterized protein LOC108735467 [Agrilus planipennis]|nr:uncharacterized protein LOC108735467 [Agrilus planipennis]